jgi:hypothetical protein
MTPALRRGWTSFRPAQVDQYSGGAYRLNPRDAEPEQLDDLTLTNLYNAAPSWLVAAHRAIDDAVASAYGWDGVPQPSEIVDRLYELNQELAGPA